MRDRPSLRTWVAYFLVALVYTSPLYVHPTYAGGHLDWRFFHYLHEVSRTTVLQYHELPLWNPWGCGGTPHLANAQTQFLSPYFVLFLGLGVAIAQKLFILIHFWLGLVGMHLLVVREGRPTVAAVASALVFALCGFHAMRAGGGHAAFLPFLYLPWLLLAYGAARDNLRHAILLGLIVAETVLEGGIYPTALFLLLLVFEGVYDLVTAPVARWRPVAIGGIAGLVFVAVSAAKLGPVLQFLWEQPRLIPLDDKLDLTLYLKAFLSRSLERNLPGHEYVWHEYINYVGPLPLLAFVVLWGRRDEEPLRRWVWAVVLFSLLMLGDHGWLAPYSLLHQVPVYKSLRVPSRYGILVVLHLALLFGVFINWLDFRCEDWARRVRRRWLAWPVRRGAYLLLLGTALDMGVTSGRLWWPGFRVKPVPGITQELFQGNGSGNDMWWRVRQNEGTPNCYEVNPLPTARGIWRGKGPQARLEPNTAGQINAIAITPNTWRVQAHLEQPARLLINQNYHRFWRLKRGQGQVVSADGMLALDLSAGDQDLTLSYRPAYLNGFLLSSVLALPAVLVLWWLLGRRRRT
ncbi:MAG: hypothetical protein ABIJ09_09995 [Pseudomonadota bacterium]